MHFLSGDPKDFYHCKHLRPSQLPPDDLEQGTANDTADTNTSSSLPRAPSEVRKRTATSSVCTELVLYDLPMIKVAHYIVANVIQYGRVAKHTMVGLGVIAFLTTLFPGIARMVNGYGFFGSDAAVGRPATYHRNQIGRMGGVERGFTSVCLGLSVVCGGGVWHHPDLLLHLGELYVPHHRTCVRTPHQPALPPHTLRERDTNTVCLSVCPCFSLSLLPPSYQ